MARHVITERAVGCRWAGCGNITRDGSQLCYNHRRFSAVVPNWYDGPLRLRVPATARYSVDDPDYQEYTDHCRWLMVHRPTLLYNFSGKSQGTMEELSEIRLAHFGITRPTEGSWEIEFHDSTVSLNDGETVEIEGCKMSRSKQDLILRGNPIPVLTAVELVEVGDAVWRAVFYNWSVPEAGETYDDLAELMAVARPFGAPQGVDVQYSSPGNAYSAEVCCQRRASGGPDDGSLLGTRFHFDHKIRNFGGGWIAEGWYLKGITDYVESESGEDRSVTVMATENPEAFDARLSALTGEGLEDGVYRTMNVLNRWCRFGMGIGTSLHMMPGWTDVPLFPGDDVLESSDVGTWRPSA
jgi:hypothetical protein